MSKAEEDEEFLPKTPNQSVGKSNPYIHTPRLEHPVLDNSPELFDPVKLLKEKDRQLLEMADYKRVEIFVDEEEKKSIQEMKTENAVLKEQVAEISVMRSEIEKMKREMREKDDKVAKIEREKNDIESNSAGLEMQFEQYKQKMTNREKELLAMIENSGGNGLNGIKESLAKMERENDQLKMEIEREKFSRSDENIKSEKMITNLRDEMNHSEKVWHETEVNLRKQIRALEANENFEKISKMEEDTKDLRDQILMLQKTISTLEQEKLELSMKGIEAPSVCLASEETLRDVSTNMDISLQPMDETLREENTLQLSGDNQSLLDMDQTLLCTLMCNGKSDSYSHKNPTVTLELPKTEQKQVEEIEILTGQVSENMQQIEKLTNQLSESIQENEKLSSQLLESAQEYDALKEKYEKILTEENFKTCQLQANFDRLTNAFGRLEDELKETEASVQILQKEKDNLLEERDSTKEQWSQQKLELEKKVTYHSEKAARCEEKIMELNKQIGELVLKSEDMKNKLEMSQIQLNGNIDLNTDLAEYSDTQTELSQERNILKSRVEEVSKQCTQLENEKLTLQKELKSAKGEFDAILREKLDHSNVEIGQLRENLQCSEGEVDKLTKRLNKLELEEREMIKTIETIQNSHENQVKEIKSNAEVKQQQLQNEKDELSRINNQLETVIRELKSVLVELNEDLTKNEKDLQNERESKENLEKEIEKIRQLHREEIMTIKTEAAENSKSKEEISMLKGVLSTKNIKFEQLSSNYDNILQKFNELERQNELNLSEIESLRQNISHLSHVASEKDKEMDELRLKLREETDQINRLTDKLAKFSDLKEELQVKKDENNNLKDEIVSVKKLAEDRKDEIAELQQTICEKVIKINQMEEEFSKEKAQVSSNDAQVAELKKENDEIVKEYKFMKTNYDKKIKSLKDANDFIAIQRDDLKSKLHDRENVIGSKEKEIELLKGCVKKKEKSIEILNGLLKEKVTEINELKVNKKFDRVTGRSSSPTTMEVVLKEKRKSDRQSLYDINRSIQFEVERDVGTMTDPTSDSCQCQYLAEKITNLKKEITVMEYKLSDPARNMEMDSLKNDMQMLQLEMVKKDQAIRTMSEDLVKRQQELSEKEAEMKRMHQMRINSSTILHTASQTEQLSSRCGTLDSGVILRGEFEETRRQLKNLQDRYARMQDEWQTKSEVAKSAMDELKTKYNNLKRAFFKLKQNYEGH